MPTVLTTPIAKNAVSATIDAWDLSLFRNPADLTVDPTQTNFTVTLNQRFADGSVAKNIVVGLAYSSLPTSAQNALKSFHASVVAYMRATGALPAGTDTPDI